MNDRVEVISGDTVVATAKGEFSKPNLEENNPENSENFDDLKMAEGEIFGMKNEEKNSQKILENANVQEKQENSQKNSPKTLSEQKMIERAHLIGSVLQGKNPTIISATNIQKPKIQSEKIEAAQNEEDITFREKMILGASSIGAAIGGFFWKNRRKKSEKNSRK